MGHHRGAAVLTLVGVIDPFPFSALWRDAALNDHSLPVWGWWSGGRDRHGRRLALGVAAQRRLPPTSASLMLTLEVVAGAVAAYLVLGDADTAAAGRVRADAPGHRPVPVGAALRRRPPAEAAVTDPAPGGDRGAGDTDRHETAGRALLVRRLSRCAGTPSHDGLAVPYMPTRPFRVNAAALHSYSLTPNNRTRYLAELRSGSELLAVDTPTAGRGGSWSAGSRWRAARCC
ncbi:hypothetical protein Srubr_18660 [Streptomyces rubradiris]|uniref:3-dehydroquinate synthase C-terminal domain-containing protein n=1 Tax=Streptomyces rubradiris TaxID=285531 RepID=A0ABQ3R844_STRRR|nr:hypothetical protein Srubr_18660 [Streptomyces rubradiris]